MDSRQERLSRYLSYVLRHNPSSLGLTPDGADFVSLARLISAIRREKKWSWVTLEDVEGIQQRGGKMRFEIIGGRVRALYGHTLPAKVRHEEAVPPKILYHGTATKNLQSIRKDGLSPMHRQYVHLSSTADEAESVGFRRDEKPVILLVRALDAYRGGVKFYLAGSVFLSEPIPPEYLETMNGLNLA
jgi:putative RNA 2'-phosphotransferase